MKLKVKDRVAILSDGLTLTYPTNQEIAKIKRGLTFDNPAYKNALRYSKYNHVSLPPYLMYYEQGKYNGIPCIRVPVGFDIESILEEDASLEDLRVYTKIPVSPFVLTLREDQKEAAETYLKQRDDFPCKSIIQLPTGKGKTILGLYIASVLSCKTLIVVHKDDLVTGWKKDIELSFGGKVHPGLIKAKSKRVGNFITIATVQTLSRMNQKELEELYDTFGFVIQDEMHHCPASSYSVVSHFKPMYRLGLTATPERTDGLTHIMSLYYGGICYKYKESKDGKDEDILQVNVIHRALPKFYYDPVFQIEKLPNGKLSYKLIEDKMRYSPYVLKQGTIRLSEIPFKDRARISHLAIDGLLTSDKNYLTEVCKDVISEYKQGHSCLVFFTQKDSCRKFQELLLQLYPPMSSHVGLYYGDNSDNDLVLKRAENERQYVTVTTYAKGTEGTNVKQWEVCFLASSINNGKNTEQAVGRIRRKKGENKLEIAKLYDYRTPNVFSLSKHGFTRDDRYRKLHFMMDGRKESSGNSIDFRKLFNRGY